MKLLVVALGALAVAGLPHSWRTFRGDWVSVRYPPGWTATARPLTPVTWPVQALAVGSYRFPTDEAGADGCEPKQALDALPADGVFIFGWDYGRLPRSELRASFPPRPKHFRLTGLANYECLGRSYLIRFRAHGRGIQIHVSIGPKATASQRATALRVLDSLRVSGNGA